MNSPKVSVLIPTYNYARFLPEAVASVLEQMLKDFELLIVDDASTDNTAELAQALAKKDARIRFIQHPANVGMVNNWNFCLRESRGEYIKFLFGDDRLCGEDALGKMVELLEANPTATLAASARVVFDEDSHVVDLYRDLPNGLHKGPDVINSVLMAAGKNKIGEPSAVLFRKKDAPNGFSTRYRQVVDVEMWFNLLEKGDLIYTEAPLCAFRIHSRQETQTNTTSGVAIKEYAEFFSNYASRPELPRNVVFPILHHLQKLRAIEPAAEEGERRLKLRLGKGWLVPYWFYCLGYRIAKPFRNFTHSIQKRRFRRLHPVITNSICSF